MKLLPHCQVFCPSQEAQRSLGGLAGGTRGAAAAGCPLGSWQPQEVLEKTPAAESTRSPLDPLPLQQLIGLVNSNGTGGAR